MASQIKTTFNEGGANIPPTAGADPSLASALRDGVDDITELRTQFAALLAKLDADAGVTDTNYASTLALATQNLTKG